MVVLKLEMYGKFLFSIKNVKSNNFFKEVYYYNFVSCVCEL